MSSPVAAEAQYQLHREPSPSSQLFASTFATPTSSEAKLELVPMSPISEAWPSPRTALPALSLGFSLHAGCQCDWSRQGERDEHACHPREPQLGPFPQFSSRGSRASQPPSNGRHLQLAVRRHVVELWSTAMLLGHRCRWPSPPPCRSKATSDWWPEVDRRETKASIWERGTSSPQDEMRSMAG
ncbi:hypothetical protein HPB51_018315 [Rhipicephalus microplus]|uniref:Uncharacterized protein n=1 Tax=Rhipicephalus microplus TaxID=6941 RepID=A0A9J6DID8_RHIMP|nr:hypothetical protein HPB51_018315 [Rhipicephalus microplus]